MMAQQIYEFGEFRIDAEQRQLLRDGKVIPLTPKAFDTLMALVENSGRVVKKDDLMKRVWPDAFVEEANLAQNVSVIRRALNGQGEQYIETVPKLGYRLTLRARLVEAPSAELLGQFQSVAAAPAAILVKPSPVEVIADGRANVIDPRLITIFNLISQYLSRDIDNRQSFIVGKHRCGKKNFGHPIAIDILVSQALRFAEE